MHEIRMHRGFWAAVLAVAACLCMLGAATSAQAANHEDQFCWGRTVTASQPCQAFESEFESIHRYTYAVHARGVEKSICIKDVFSGEKRCSGGPNQDVWLIMTPSSQYVWPVIYLNTSSQTQPGASTKVYGWHHYQDPPPSPPPPPPNLSWHLDNIGGSITSDPDIASARSGTFEVFARGGNGELVHKWWNNCCGYSGWHGMGGSIVGGPGAVSWGAGRMDVVAREANGTVKHWYYVNGNWASDNLGGSITSDPDIASAGSGMLEVFARGANGELVHKWWNNCCGWSGWHSMGGNIVGGPGAVSWGAGRMDVVARLADNTVQHWYYVNGNWASDNLGGSITSDPDMGSAGSGTFEIFARGSNGELVHNWWNNCCGYSGWHGMGGSITGGPGAVSWGPGRMDVVARNSGNSSVDHWYYSP